MRRGLSWRRSNCLKEDSAVFKMFPRAQTAPLIPEREADSERDCHQVRLIRTETHYITSWSFIPAGYFNTLNVAVGQSRGLVNTL